MSSTQTTPYSEQGQLSLSRSYVRDGMMRAYANRFALLAIVNGAVALICLAFAIYVRLQPVTLIRVAPNGEPTVIQGRSPFKKPTPAELANAATSPEPQDYEKERLVRDFLDDYLNYDFNNVRDRWISALNLANDTLSRSAVDVIKKEDRVGQVRNGQVRSTFVIREIEPSKQDPLVYTVYGIRNVYRIDGTQEVAEQMVNRYIIRLALVDRKTDPRGIEIGDYQEMQLEGERKEPQFPADTAGIGSSQPNP